MSQASPKSIVAGNTNQRVSSMVADLTGSEILKIAAEIRTLSARGVVICNLTVGDFTPAQFRIPRLLEDEIQHAVSAGETNYPPSEGMLSLRRAVQEFYARWLKLEYPIESILITGGSRPGIYATYRAVVDPGDVVVYPTPSWNNNHYCHLVGADGRPVDCGAETRFLPTRKKLENAVRGARLLALNSPLNPTGTAFSPEILEEICDLVLEENARRPGERPLYLLYDQVYWMLTFGETRHVNPVTIRPEIAPYTIFVDGISKAFAATGVRVGWTIAPTDISERMVGFLGHVGAWAPRAEQVATAKLLHSTDLINEYHDEMKSGIQARLNALFTGLKSLQRDGVPVDAVSPMGAIYLSARFSFQGKRTSDGLVLNSSEDVRRYLLDKARLAIVPFQAFGTEEDHGWFRLSVGAVSLEEIEEMLPRLKNAYADLTT
ncbi:MAG TPA: aminotransferase class I/II-fold pyridoxal phosphate-dependent enzyme [Bacteroidota bacterium]